MRSIHFADASAFIALVDPSDVYHGAADEHLERFLRDRGRLVTTNFILDEAITRFRRSVPLRETVGRMILESAYVDYVRLEARDEQRAWDSCLKLRDKAFSFTDLTSFAVMERLGLRRVFTFDEDFRRYGKFEMVPR